MNAILAMFTWAVVIPDVVWSGLLAAGITLFGVVLANMQNAKRQWQQHAFDAEESRRERRHELRKEVYLPLASAMADVQNALSQLGNADDAAAKPTKKLAEASSKLSLVAETKTAIQAMTTSSDFAIAYIFLLQAAGPARDAKKATDKAKENAELSKKKTDLAFLRIEEHFQAGNGEGPILDALNQSLQFHRGNWTKFSQDEAAGSELHARETFAYLRILVDRLPAIIAGNAELLTSLRRDMGIETDEVAYLNTFVEQSERLRQELVNALTKYENMLDDGVN